MLLADTTALSQMSLGVVVLVIGALCAGFALIRGAFRMMTVTAMLAAALLVAYWVWMETPGVGNRIIEKPPVWFPFILPALAGIAAYMILKKVLGIVLKPFGTPGGAPSSLVGKFFSLLSVSCQLPCSASQVQPQLGTLELSKKSKILTKLTPPLPSKTIDNYIPPAWTQRLDPLTDPQRITLAKLLSMGRDEHIPRAIPVAEAGVLQQGVLADPRLRELSKEGRFADILRDPAIDDALDDPRIKRALEELNKRGY